MALMDAEQTHIYIHCIVWCNTTRVSASPLTPSRPCHGMASQSRDKKDVSHICRNYKNGMQRKCTRRSKCIELSFASRIRTGERISSVHLCDKRQTARVDFVTRNILFCCFHFTFCCCCCVRRQRLLQRYVINRFVLCLLKWKTRSVAIRSCCCRFAF